MIGKRVTRELEHVTNAVRGGSGLARVLLGRRATGKTTALWRLGDASSMRVLRASANPDDSGEPFSLLHQLFDVPTAPDSGELHRMRREFWAFLQQQPTLLLVDDVHRADPHSARVVAHAARQASGHPVGIVLAASAEHALHPELEQLPSLELTGADRSDARALLADSGVDAPEHVLTELLRSCEANPLVLREFLDVLSTDQLRGRVPLPRRIALGRRSLRAFGEPFAHLPHETSTWLLLLAHGPPELATCLRAARSLGLDLDALAPAERANVVRIRGEVVWPSLLVRAAVRQSAPIGETDRPRVRGPGGSGRCH